MLLWAGCPLAFGAVDFDGTDDYIKGAAYSSTLDLSGTSFTLAAWLRPTSNTLSIIISKPYADGVHNSPYFDWSLAFSVLTAGRVTVFLGCSLSHLGNNTSLTLNAWNHIAVTYNGSTLNFYLNGISDGTPAVTCSITNTNSAPFRIGSNGAGQENFPGIIDDVRVYNRVLSASEIEVIANGRLKYDSLTTPGNGLVGYWPLDDSPDGTSGDGDTFVDRSGNGNNGTGVDGANNTGLTARASGFLMYPAPVQ